MDATKGLAYVGLDPSFSCTGVAVFDGTALSIHRIESPPSELGFEQIYRRGYRMSGNISKLVPDNSIVGMEMPPPVAHFAAGLFSLDTHIVNRLLGKSSVFAFHPTYMGYLHEKRKYPKRESTLLATHLLDLLKPIPINVKRICNDEAEAFLILTRLLIRFDVIPEFTERVLDIKPRFGTEKETYISVHPKHPFLLPSQNR